MAAARARLKKRSGANSTEKRREAFVFFLDRNLGNKQVAGVLRQAGAVIEVHNDHFLPDAKDEDWLLVVGQKRWIVLTKDDRIRYRVTERAALIRARVAMFTLTSGNLKGEEMAQAFVKALPRIRRFIAKNRPPFIARVTKSGAVSMLFSSAGL